MLAFGIACAVASGREFLGWAAPSAADVLYLDGELQGEVLKERFELFHETFGDEVAERIKFVTPDIQTDDMPDLTQPSGQAQIDELVTENTALIVVDSLSMFCLSGVENDSESWLPVYKWARRHRKNGRSILFIHHSGKSGKQRGTSRREDAPDVIVALRQSEDYSPENNADFEVVFEKTRHPLGKDAVTFRAKIEQQNGRIEWTLSGDKRTERLEEIASLLSAGNKQKDIAKQLGLSKGRISHLVQEARDAGLIDVKAA